MTGSPVSNSVSDPVSNNTFPSSKRAEVRVFSCELRPSEASLFTSDPAVAHLFDPTQPFYRRGRSACFVAVEPESLTTTQTQVPEPARVLGRIAAFVDPAAKPVTPGERTGAFGFFECPEDNGSVAHALLRAAEEWLAAQGCTEVVGPLNFTIFHGYRIMTSGFESSPYLGEPRTPRPLRERLEQAGYSSCATWRTYDFSAADHLEQVEIMSEILRPFEPSLRDYHIVPLGQDSLSAEEELITLYPLVIESFANNFAATALSLEEFINLYKPLVPLLCPASSFRIVHNDQNVGFSIGYRNPLNPGTAVWHSFGNTKSHRGKGLGYLCIARVFEGFVKQGYRGSHCSLVKEGPNHFEHTHSASRTYSMFRRRIARTKENP